MKAAYSTRKSLSHVEVSVIIINHIPSLRITKNFKKNQSKKKQKTKRTKQTTKQEKVVI
jgi:hypothetical protein